MLNTNFTPEKVLAHKFLEKYKNKKIVYFLETVNKKYDNYNSKFHAIYNFLNMNGYPINEVNGALIRGLICVSAESGYKN
jgi:hypothetical protein